MNSAKIHVVTRLLMQPRRAAVDHRGEERLQPRQAVGLVLGRVRKVLVQPPVALAPALRVVRLQALAEVLAFPLASKIPVHCGSCSQLVLASGSVSSGDASPRHTVFAAPHGQVGGVA